MDLSIFLGALICLAVTTGQRRLDIYEGDACKQESGTLWTCKKSRECPKAQEMLKQGIRPEICRFSGRDPDPVVCCEPPVKTPTVGEKSKEMCKKYAEYVYIPIPSPDDDDTVLNYDTCAASEPLITLGKNAEPREFPHMALIGYGDKDAISWLCGGSLISERFILSAAHCSDPGGTTGPARWARLGDYDISTKEDEDNGLAQEVEYEIIERITHPNYKSSSWYDDIVLFKLAGEVRFNEFRRPICLQVEHQFPKTYALATGWGRTDWARREPSDILQKVNLTIAQRKKCNDDYKNIKKEKLLYGIKDESMLCAGDGISGKDTCQGDSGGPLQIRLREPYCMYSQVGIVSSGSICGGNNAGVYTRVSHYVSWIESKVWP